MNLARAAASLHFGARGNLLTYDPVQTAFGVACVIAVCGVAILSMGLVGHNVSSLLEQTARVDPLMGVLNRRGIEELLAAELERARRSGARFSIAGARRRPLQKASTTAAVTWAATRCSSP